MIGRLLGIFGGREEEAVEAPLPAYTSPPHPRRLPAELVAAIESAHIIFREPHDETTDGFIMVTISSVGRWNWDGRDDAAKRVLRSYPELDKAGARRAADLIAAQIGRRSRPRSRASGRTSWMNDW